MKEIEILRARLEWVKFAEMVLTRVGLYLGAFEAYANVRTAHGSRIPPEDDEGFWNRLSLAAGSDGETRSSAGSTTPAGRDPEK